MDRIRGITFVSFLVITLVLGASDAVAVKTAKGSKVPVVKSAIVPVPSEPVKIFKEATFLFPKGIKISPKWVVPPMDAAQNGADFSMDDAGNPVLGWQTSSAYTLLYPTKEYGVSLSPFVSDFLHLDNGVMLLVSENRVGIMVRPESKKFNEKKLPMGEFQPIVTFPVKSIDAIGKSGSTFYCAGMSTKTKRYSLYALRSLKGGGVTDTELLYESDEPINAIGADTEGVYVAKGREVVRIAMKEGNTTTLYIHPSEKVIDIAPFKEGIIVGTATEAVYIGPKGTIEIVRSSGHRIAIRQDTLFLFFPKSLGILALDNLSEMGRFNLSVQPARSDKTTLPISVEGVHFFESSAPPYTQKLFSGTFEKGNIRRIIAQIDLKALQPSKKEKKHTLTVSWYEPTGGKMLSRSYPITLKSSIAQPFFASIGEESDIKWYVPRTKGEGGYIWRLGKDAFGSRYPGKYHVNVQIDGIVMGEWEFTIMGQNTFLDAVFYDDLPMIKTILDQTPITQYADAEGNSFLNLAIEYGSVDAVKLVLSKGVNPNAADQKGKKPLQCLWPAASEWKKKAELLIQHGGSIYEPVGPNKESIIEGIYNSEMVAFMIRKGAEIYTKDKDGKYSLNRKARSSCSEEVINALVERGVDLNTRSPEYPYQSFLGEAIAHSDAVCVESLLKRGASYAVVQNKTATEPERSGLYVALDKLNMRTSGQYNIKWSAEEIAKSRKIVRLLVDRGAKLISGKKRVATNYFEAKEKYYSTIMTSDSSEAYSRYMQEEDLIRRGEGRIMFQGESPSFFSREEMVKMLEVDDSALEEASRSKDDEIRQIALLANLERVREIVGIAKSSTYLYTARDHCNEAFKIAEAGYQAMQVSYIPDTLSIVNKDLFFLPREGGGVYVHKTIPQSAADNAGLLPGDIILAIDTQKIKKGDEFKAALSALTPGIPVQITFLRAKPSAVSELLLTCGILEYARKEKATAQMYLGQWLVSKPSQEDMDKISTILGEVFK